MSANFMFLIAALYGAAVVSFAIEGKWLWAVISCCWGVGNALLGIISK